MVLLFSLWKSGPACIVELVLSALTPGQAKKNRKNEKFVGSLWACMCIFFSVCVCIPLFKRKPSGEETADQNTKNCSEFYEIVVSRLVADQDSFRENHRPEAGTWREKEEDPNDRVTQVPRNSLQRCFVSWSSWLSPGAGVGRGSPIPPVWSSSGLRNSPETAPSAWVLAHCFIIASSLTDSPGDSPAPWRRNCPAWLCLPGT